MWNYKYIARIDFKIVFIIFLLMVFSLLVISSMTENGGGIFTIWTIKQMRSYLIGWIVFFFFAGFDYRKLMQWTWILYFLMVVLLLGIYYFASPIHKVYRWYRIPFLNMSMQPSEYAKLTLVICLAWFLEKKGKDAFAMKSFFQVFIITFVPFFLILKQPDLGSALVLYPVALVMCFFGGINIKIIKFFLYLGIIALIFTNLIFFKILPYEKLKPFISFFMKNYQLERFNPSAYHKKAADISISIGGVKGVGWNKSEFAKRKWLPASYTDSVFASFAEEFGLIGSIFLLFIFFVLIYLSFQIIEHAKDNFGKLLSSGIAVYLAMHIIINIAMMCGYLPISGVPLLFMTYGGSSVVSAMAALGILQSIYTRRFMFHETQFYI